MIYKITNIRLRSGRTLNRGFIIESDKMLSRNKIATLIKERTNFTPVDFSSKIHRSLLESKKDVDAAIAAGNAKIDANEKKNQEIRKRNEDLYNSYKTKHEDKVKGARDEESSKFYNKLNAEKQDLETSIATNQGELEKLNGIKSELKTHDETINEINKQLKEIKTQEETLSANLNTENEKRKAALNGYESEAALDKKINELETEIASQTDLRDNGFENRETEFKNNLGKKYDFDKVFDKQYKKDYDKNKEKEIDKNEGVNLAKVENYFNKKAEDLNKIIQKLEKQSKKKDGTVIYQRLDKTIEEFKKTFNSIKVTVIAQYKNKEKLNNTSSNGRKGTSSNGRNKKRKKW